MQEAGWRSDAPEVCWKKYGWAAGGGFLGYRNCGQRSQSTGPCRRQTRGGMSKVQATAVVADVNPAETVVREQHLFAL